MINHKQLIESIEYPFIKSSFEVLNKTFRNTQKSVEKDFLILDKVLKDSKKMNQEETSKIKKILKIR